MGEMRYNGVSDAAVRDATGKGWQEWFAILDKVGAQAWKHPQIARFLANEQGAADWWSQMITVGYEQARGLRLPGQHADGFAISASRTLAVPLETVYLAWMDEGQRALWLPDVQWTLTKATPNRSLRLLWADNASRIDVDFRPKGEAKSRVALEHSKLSDAEAAAQYKAFWTEALDRLLLYVESVRLNR